MSQKTSVYPGLTEIFRDLFMRDDLVLNPEMTADDVEGWDSFKQIEIIMAVQDRFGIRLSTREIDNLSNVGDLAQVVESKLST